MKNGLTEEQRRKLYQQMAESNAWAAYEAAKRRRLSELVSRTPHEQDRAHRELADRLGL